MNRSYLFVPADSKRKLAKASDCGADALILDLEDSVTAAARPQARQQAAEFLGQHNNVWVRINPIDTADATKDLDAVIAAGPAGIVLPKPRSAADANQLALQLDELESQRGLTPGQTKIMAICTERPAALFTMQSYLTATERLSALSWGAEDLAAAMGASANRDLDGRWLPPYEMARSLALCAAMAANVAAVDTVYADYQDADGLARYASNARRDGFTGMLAIHPAQVEIINRAFLPTSAEIERAQRIVALFDANPDQGTLGLDGAMLDKPHLVHAQRLLQLAKKLAAL
jgi:citrate lyase subunit beta/citryl-CoA lyase